MRVLGIDHGDRHIGLALSDPLRVAARPLGTYLLRARDEDNREYFRKLVREHEIGAVVVGLPLRLDGTEGRRAETTREFAAWLKAAVGIEVAFWDERLTTQQAAGAMREQKVRLKDRRSVVNQIAAVLILQSYLDSRRGDARTPDVD
ncbi:MAG: Holliday junction resolvase RuvX [Candidatus Aminicenantes bacterium]|nr:Holliday junction resolvase RuvX [Candidatus Aminicenantes bacterium]